MATQKMTFTVPETPYRDRSRFVSEALSARLAERDLQLIHGCETANMNVDVAAIEKEFDGIRDEVPELWM